MCMKEIQSTNTTVVLEIPDELQRDILSVPVSFYNFSGELSFGNIEVHKSIADDVREVFEIILREKFPIHSVIPISEFGRDDDVSMAANNSSAFNCRTVTNKPDVISIHGYGLAFDINPVQNPYIDGDKIYPPNGEYIIDQLGTLTAKSSIVQFLKQRGFIWGGDWDKSYKDYQHFQKEIPEELREKYSQGLEK